MHGCVIVGDIVKSRKLEDLPAVLGRLKRALNRINRRHRDDLLGAFKVFGGDSFEGVLWTPCHAYDVYREIAMALRPARARCVVAMGEITDLADGNVLEMNGPVFERAAQRLEEMRKLRSRPKVYLSFVSDMPDQDSLLNALAMLILAIQEKWKETTWEVAESADLGVNEIARRLGISRMEVHRKFSIFGIDAVAQAEREIQAVLNRMK